MFKAYEKPAHDILEILLNEYEQRTENATCEADCQRAYRDTMRIAVEAIGCFVMNLLDEATYKHPIVIESAVNGVSRDLKFALDTYAATLKETKQQEPGVRVSEVRHLLVRIPTPDALKKWLGDE